jgi:hypothetical protein
LGLSNRGNISSDNNNNKSNNRSEKMVNLQWRSYIQKSTNVMDKDNLKIGAMKIYFLRAKSGNKYPA